MSMMKGYRLYKGAWIVEADPHNERRLTTEEKNTLLDSGGMMVRNVYDFDCGEATSFWYVIKDEFGGMEELSSKMRNQVRRCFRSMHVVKIGAERLLSEGYEVYGRAFERYAGKAGLLTKEAFEKRILNAEENEFWGVIDNATGKLVAFSMNAVTAESCEYRTMKALPEYQKEYAYYGLIYEMNRYYLSGDNRVRYVNDGARSLTNHSNIQPFLIDKFNFRKAYCHIDVHYRWWLKVAVVVLMPLRRWVKIGSVRALLEMEYVARQKR